MEYRVVIEKVVDGVVVETLSIEPIISWELTEEDEFVSKLTADGVPFHFSRKTPFMLTLRGSEATVMRPQRRLTE